MALRPVSAAEIESLAIGAWILGTGGGGSPYLALLNMRKLYREGVVCSLLDPMDLADDARVAVVSNMGAPLVGQERLTDPQTIARAVRMMEEYRSCRFDAVMSLEIGGGNSLQPFMAAAVLGLPVVDADCMGRAFPEAQMTSFAIHDLTMYPLTLADVRDNAVVVARAASWKWMERLSRKACVEVGSIASTCKAPRTGKEVKECGILYSTTKAIRLGATVQAARRQHRDAVQAVIDAERGQLMFRGKIRDVARRTTEGFLRGTAKLDGLDDFRGQSFELAFQNEFAVGWLDGRPRVMRRIGIDVGGTNTDAVYLEDTRVVHAVKTPTTRDVTSGVTEALRQLLRAGTPVAVDAVMIGTTHFTNAVVQRRDLTKVAAIRIGLPSGASLEPFIDWPDDLAALVRGEIVMLEGGHEFDGRPLVPLDLAGMRAAARRIRDAGLTSVGVASVFSPLNAACELEAAAILREECPDVAVTMSHQLGRIGLLERENAALLNAVLVGLARTTTRAFTDALAVSGITAPLYLTQNDGAVMLASVAEVFPVYGFASGPTNSMRGAAFLSKLTDALVIDVGGTTTDIGSLRHGFPREANNVVEIGGVRTLFRMPDLLSIGLGGGSLVARAPLSVGPRSVGYRLVEQGLVFGGSELTATDVAVAAGLIDLGDRRKVAALPAELVTGAIARIHAMIEEAVDRMKTDAADEPLIAVGGGCFLVPDRIAGISEVIHVEHQAVANAVGAAIAQVSGEVDRIFQDLSRDDAIARARQLAEAQAASAGADPRTLTTVEVEDLPLAYLPGNSLRVRVRVVGEIR